jgi:hypothetical protein
MQETQMYENELKEVNEYISALAARLRNSKPNVPRKPNKKKIKSYHLFFS